MGKEKAKTVPDGNAELTKSMDALGVFVGEQVQHYESDTWSAEAHGLTKNEKCLLAAALFKTCQQLLDERLDGVLLDMLCEDLEIGRSYRKAAGL